MSQPSRPEPSPQPDPLVERLGDADGPQALLAVYYQVPDVALAAEWYSRLFGAAPLTATPGAAIFDIGGDELVLVRGDADLCGPGTTVFWSVESLPDACRRVEQLGITLVEAPRQRDARTRTACISDPFGNLVGLMERDDPLLRRARSQRAAEKVALRNVREKLDQLQDEERQQKLAFKIVMRVLLAALALGLFVLLALMAGPTK